MEFLLGFLLENQEEDTVFNEIDCQDTENLELPRTILPYRTRLPERSRHQRNAEPRDEEKEMGFLKTYLNPCFLFLLCA